LLVDRGVCAPSTPSISRCSSWTTTAATAPSMRSRRAACHGCGSSCARGGARRGARGRSRSNTHAGARRARLWQAAGCAQQLRARDQVQQRRRGQHDTQWANDRHREAELLRGLDDRRKRDQLPHRVEQQERRGEAGSTRRPIFFQGPEMTTFRRTSGSPAIARGRAARRDRRARADRRRAGRERRRGPRRGRSPRDEPPLRSPPRRGGFEG